jgi:L-type amino acid transporter 9
VPPESGVGDTPPLPYYLYCLIGIAVMMFGVLYWAVWKLMLPYVFKFRLVPRKVLLQDGTVVVLVSILCSYHRSAVIMLTGIKFSREKVD